MLKYLTILLDDTSTSFCHYENPKENFKLIGLADLKAGIMFAIKENLIIQIVLPNYELPQEYNEVIHSVEHISIISSLCEDSTLQVNADIVVFDDWIGLDLYSFKEGVTCLIRTSKHDFFERYLFLQRPLSMAARVNIILTDIKTFNDKDTEKYEKILATLSEKIEKLCLKGKSPQLNLLTNRIRLRGMNNCDEDMGNITLAPNGKFYVCPAFYLVDDFETKFSIGDLKFGLDLEKLQRNKFCSTPPCQNCNTYQHINCAWLDNK